MKQFEKYYDFNSMASCNFYIEKYKQANPNKQNKMLLIPNQVWNAKLGSYVYRLHIDSLEKENQKLMVKIIAGVK